MGVNDVLMILHAMDRCLICGYARFEGFLLKEYDLRQIWRLVVVDVDLQDVWQVRLPVQEFRDSLSIHHLKGIPGNSEIPVPIRMG